MALTLDIDIDIDGKRYIIMAAGGNPTPAHVCIMETGFGIHMHLHSNALFIIGDYDEHSKQDRKYDGVSRLPEKQRVLLNKIIMRLS
jgi:hypothetical protein